MTQMYNRNGRDFAALKITFHTYYIRFTHVSCMRNFNMVTVGIFQEFDLPGWRWLCEFLQEKPLFSSSYISPFDLLQMRPYLPFDEAAIHTTNPGICWLWHALLTLVLFWCMLLIQEIFFITSLWLVLVGVCWYGNSSFSIRCLLFCKEASVFW